MRMSDKKKAFSLAYALQWQCPYKCPICHAVKTKGRTDINKWKAYVKPIVSANTGSVRLTLTGGEPMLHWTSENDALLKFIRHLYENQIHVCLNTTGYHLNLEKLYVLDNYIDSILLSVRGLTVNEIMREFGLKDEDNAKQLLDYQLGVISGINRTNIKLEISTVVTKKNIDDIEELGWKLLSINPNVIWRVEEYYANGMQLTESHEREYELEAARYDALMIDLYQIFSNKFKLIRHSSKESRVNAPDVFLFPNGELHQTSNNMYRKVCHVTEYDFGETPNRREWSSYKSTLRKRSWQRDLL